MPDPITESDVRELIHSLTTELAPNPAVESIESAHLIVDLEFHSLALLELAYTLEDEYDLQPIDEPTARAIQTVGDVCAHVINELRDRGELAGAPAAVAGAALAGD